MRKALATSRFSLLAGSLSLSDRPTPSIAAWRRRVTGRMSSPAPVAGLHLDGLDPSSDW
jgi:hypothetical protein